MSITSLALDQARFNEYHDAFLDHLYATRDRIEQYKAAEKSKSMIAAIEAGADKQLKFLIETQRYINLLEAALKRQDPYYQPSESIRFTGQILPKEDRQIERDNHIATVNALDNV